MSERIEDGITADTYAAIIGHVNKLDAASPGAGQKALADVLAGITAKHRAASCPFHDKVRIELSRLDIDELRDQVKLLQDGIYRACSTLHVLANKGLSEHEKDAIAGFMFEALHSLAEGLGEAARHRLDLLCDDLHARPLIKEEDTA